jgi:hypothetical protein
MYILRWPVRLPELKGSDLRQGMYATASLPAWHSLQLWYEFLPGYA